MEYIIKREDFIESLRLREDISLKEKVKQLDNFDNIILCPYRGHKIDLRELRNFCVRSDEYRCPECNEWIRWNTHLPWFQQAPYHIGSSMIHHKKNYKCIVNPNFEKIDYRPTNEELETWFDKNLNPIRPNTIPLKPGEKAIPLSETTYVAIKE